MKGVLVIDKPSGITSHDVVKRVKRLIKVKKAGHTGTLDPLATGVLPICINEATKIAQFLINDNKEYKGELRLGIETDTQDMTGRVIRESDQIPEDYIEIIDTFDGFIGNIKQKPPVFSALKHKGVPLYKLARRGIHIDIAERDVTISKIKVLTIDLPYISFEVTCSKGTYIRTLCNDIGNRLGCGGHLVGLRRVRSGSFHIKDSHSLEDMENLIERGIVEDEIIPLERALAYLPQIRVNENLARKIKHGKQILLKDLGDISPSRFKAGENLKITSLKNDLIAIAESLINYPLTYEKDRSDKVCRLIRVFNM